MDFLFLGQMKIGIDLMGGDFAPLEAIKGIKDYLSETAQPEHLVLFGDEEKIYSRFVNLPDCNHLCKRVIYRFTF